MKYSHVTTAKLATLSVGCGSIRYDLYILPYDTDDVTAHAVNGQWQ